MNHSYLVDEQRWAVEPTEFMFVSSITINKRGGAAGLIQNESQTYMGKCVMSPV